MSATPLETGKNEELKRKAEQQIHSLQFVLREFGYDEKTAQHISPDLAGFFRDKNGDIDMVSVNYQLGLSVKTRTQRGEQVEMFLLISPKPTVAIGFNLAGKPAPVSSRIEFPGRIEYASFYDGNVKNLEMEVNGERTSLSRI